MSFFISALLKNITSHFYFSYLLISILNLND
nr:MAG TPA: hypothetical protein [Bacteriophage sp.]